MWEGERGMGRTFEALKVRNYRLFALGGFVSNIGTWMHNVGAAWLMTLLTPSTAAGSSWSRKAGCCWRLPGWAS